ncbi:MAG: hypothetical protein V2A73_02305 [Pseudomonadota bacterium]
MSARVEHPLLTELIDNPRLFDERGRAYQLLQEYYSGLSIETLRPLLRSQDVWIQRSASFIAAELGEQSRPLLEDVLPLMNSNDLHIQNYAMEVLTICCDGERAECFAHVAEKLASEDEGIRLQAIDLVANARRQQLEAALRFFARHHNRQDHARGLRGLLAAEGQDRRVSASMLNDPDPLVRAYGEVAFKRAGHA